MAGSLAGRVVIVTGAAGGIGSCIARAFQANGASLMLADIRAEEVSALAASLEGARAVHVDITDPDSARHMAAAAVEAFGGIDVLVSCAGLDAPPGCAWEMEDAHWRRVIDADLSGSWWCAKAVIPHMIGRPSPRIIFISSVASRRANLTTTVAYNAAKAGINGLTIGLAKQLERHGILVNAVAPGPTGNTGEPMTAEQMEAENAIYPLGFGGPEPVAEACLYLAGQGGRVGQRDHPQRQRRPVARVTNIVRQAPIRLTCAATTRQPSGNRTQLCICRPTLPGALSR